MTTLAFVAGLLPLLIATGPGAEERRSIAVLAVGGQTLSLLLTLLAIPVVYTFLDDIGYGIHYLATARWRRPQGSSSRQPAIATENAHVADSHAATHVSVAHDR